MISGIGAKKTFGIFGVLSVVDLLCFVLVNVLHDKCCPEDENKEIMKSDYTKLAEKPCCQH